MRNEINSQGSKACQDTGNNAQAQCEINSITQAL